MSKVNNMRLIDADVLSQKWKEVLEKKADEKGTVAYLTFELFIERLADEPTIDAVPVTRCAECIYAREMDKYEKQLYLDGCVGCTCLSRSYHSIIMEPTGFCSYGEPKMET